jgi:hypothetical protein
MSNVTLEQTTLPVFEICELANAVMEDFKNHKLDVGKPEDEPVVSQVLGNFIGRVIDRGLQLKWSNGKHEFAPAAGPTPTIPQPGRFHCPTKKRFAKVSASGKCSACGRVHAQGNGHHVA